MGQKKQFGEYYIGLDIGQAVGPLIVNFIAGLFLENYGYGYAALILPIICGMVVMFFVSRKGAAPKRIY